MHTLRKFVFATVAAAVLVAPAIAATTGFSGAARAQVTPVNAGEAGAPVGTSLSFPGGGATLPLQAVARVIDEVNAAAGVCGAQFADPTTASGPDTDEFAMQFALASVTDGVGFTAFAQSEETRELLFSSADLGNPAGGASVTLEGRLFLDGALALFANTEAGALTGNSAGIRVRVYREAGDEDPQLVFDGAIRVSGRSDNTSEIAFEGDFPTLGVFTTDLSIVDESLSTFRVVVFPGLIVPYEYSAAPDQPFSLRAVVESEGAITGGGVGVAAIVGTPIESLTEVVTRFADGDTAAKMTSALQEERARPTGEPAYAEQDSLVGPFAFLRACGLLGVESLVLMFAVGGLRFTGAGRRLVR